MNTSLLQFIAAVAMLAPAISANAALFNYNEQFEGNGMHFNFNFTADDTSTTVITDFNGTADTDVLTLINPIPSSNSYFNDNLFDPTTLATTGGWNANGISVHHTVSGYDFNVYYDGTNLTMFSSNPNVVDTFSNYSFSASPTAVSSVPVPAAVWLFASGLGLLTFGRRKKMTR
jgi:hypothetical protein